MHRMRFILRGFIYGALLILIPVEILILTSPAWILISLGRLYSQERQRNRCHTLNRSRCRRVRIRSATAPCASTIWAFSKPYCDLRATRQRPRNSQRSRSGIASNHASIDKSNARADRRLHLFPNRIPTACFHLRQRLQYSFRSARRTDFTQVNYKCRTRLLYLCSKRSL